MEPILTPAAGKFIRRMVRMGGGPGHGFRLVMSANGCSGLAGEFSVEAGPRPGDTVLEAGDLKLFLPAESRLLLRGVTIDFADTPTQAGLAFHDPKAAPGTCGPSDAAPPATASIAVSRIKRA